MLEYLEISWINAGSAWKTQKGCVALQLCSSGVLNLQGIPGSTCWSTTGVFVFNAGSHHTKGFDTSQQHHWRERQVASSVENSKSCPNKYHIYNSTCPKLKLDFWGFQMFPAFLSCLKLSQVVSSCLWAVPWHSGVWGSWAHPRPGTSSTDRCQPCAATATAICWRKSHVCRVVSSIEWLFSMFRLFHLCDSLINFIQFHHPCEFGTQTSQPVTDDSLARWLVGSLVRLS